MNWDYCTHVPLLYEAARLTTLPCVELGVGLCSTPLLNALVTLGTRPRDLFSCDSDANWLSIMREKFICDNHHFYHVTEWEANLNGLVERELGLVFIDNGSPKDIPGATALRWKMVEMFRKAQVLVIHDADNMLLHNISGDHARLLYSFKYQYEDTHEKPSTLWLSNLFLPTFTMQKE